MVNTWSKHVLLSSRGWGQDTGRGTRPPIVGVTLPSPRLLLDVVVEVDDVRAVAEGLEEPFHLLPCPLRQRHPVPGQVLDGG